MKPSHLRRLAAALAIASFLAEPALAQTPESSLLDALSLLSGGVLVPRDHPPEVTHEGDLYHVRVPLPALTAPPDAAIEAVARPLGSSIWDITALTLPPAGSLPMQGQGTAPPGVMTFAIGQQAFRGKIDPTLAVPSPFKADLGRITLRTEAPNQRTNQTIEHYGMEGTLFGASGGRLNARAAGSMANWLISGEGDKPGTDFKLSMRSAAVRYDVEGLDRAGAERLRLAAQSFSADRRAAAAPPGGAKIPLSPAAREQLSIMIDALAGLLTRLNVDETIQGMHFGGNSASTVDIGKIQFALACDASDGHSAVSFDITISDPVSTLAPVEFASLMPRRITVRPAMAGVRTDALIRLLHDAFREGYDPAAFRTEIAALLNEPGARAGIESLVIESGPLRLEGSARIRPLPDNTAGFDIHLTAHGLDAMIADIQRIPRAMQVLPAVFLAKGMAKPQGENLVWDIGFADGIATVNGVPLGQGQAGRPPARR